MSFIRTRSGISNLRLFYDADLVVFTEGGETSFTENEIENGNYNKLSVDIKFWDKVLKNNGFDKKVEFRAIGSKTTSQTICEKIINGEVNNVIVTRDRDLDEQLGVMFDSPFILYTKGYSWENDVFTKDLTLEQIDSMLFLTEIPEEARIIVDKSYSDFAKLGKHLTKLELLFRKHGIRFISDFNGERFFSSKKSPYIDKSQVISVLNEKKIQLDRPVTIPSSVNGLCPFFNNYGKLLQALSITIISYICKNFGGIKSIQKGIVITSMIERFSNKMNASVDEYYSDIVNELQHSL